MVDVATRQPLMAHSIRHKSDVGGLREGRSEQEVGRILQALDEAIEQLPIGCRGRVRSLGLTGQMHGVVLWGRDFSDVSHLITWQDQRCLEMGFISELRSITGDKTLQTGYGCASLAWLARFEPETLRRFTFGATIHDYLAALLTGNRDLPSTDPSDAASFGLFDILKGAWRNDAVERAQIPTSFLAQIRAAGESIGGLSEAFSERWGISAGTPVGNAVGDNQAALYGSLSEPASQISLTIGTGAQLSVVIASEQVGEATLKPSYEFRPFIGGSYLAVAASLSGGRALATLAHSLESFMKECGVEAMPSLSQIQTALHRAGLAKINTDLLANASLGGERHLPEMRGAFTNLSFDNFTVGDMSAALARSLVTYLRDALPLQFLSGKTVVVGSGNGIGRSPLIQQLIQDIFGLPLEIKEDLEATAYGAALLVVDNLSNKLG